MSSSGTESDTRLKWCRFRRLWRVWLPTWTRIYGRRTQTNGRGSECPTSGNREQPMSERHKLVLMLKKCISLPLPSECLCCHEFSLFDGQLEPSDCITDNTNFRTSYTSFLRYKRHRGKAPDVLTNRQSRLMAYRQFVCWVRKGQPLGKKYRVTLPACIVKTIREEFPSPDGNYEGFKECACESDISDSD